MPTRLGSVASCMMSLYSSYYDAVSFLSWLHLSSIFWLAWGHGLAQAWSGMEGVVWPDFELELQLARISFQKSATYKPIALLPASR